MDAGSEHSEGHGVADQLRQPEWHWPLALLLAGFYVLSSLYISEYRLLWFDEILTALVSRLASVRVLWKALCQIQDQTPPLYFLITRAFDRMFQHADIGLRVPSALALGAGLLVTFDTARRLTDGLYGLIAMSLLATPFVTYYGYEARPYAIYFMFAAISLWLWVFTKDESKTAAAAFGAVFLTATAIHYYFVLCLLPFAITALARRRLFHPKVTAAAAGVLVALAVLYPQIANARAFANIISPAWAPSITRLLAAYLEFLPVGILLLVVIAIGLVVFDKSHHHAANPMSAGERVCWLFLLLPLSAYLLGHLVTHVFHARYVIGAGPGIAVGATCLLWRHCRERRRLSAALLLAFGAFSVGQQVLTLRSIDHIPSDSGDYQERTRQLLAIEDAVLREGKRHIVFSWDIGYLETWYYTKHRSLYECVTSEQRWTIKNYVPLRFASVDEIVADAPRSAFVTPNPALVLALARAGILLKIRFAQPRLYIVAYPK